MQQVLLVEDSPMFGRLAKSKIEKVFDVPVYWTKTFAETEKILGMAKGGFSMALLDFNLPDAPNGEVIDRVIKEGITSFVFTANMSEEVRNFVWSKKVADYILKEDPNSLDYIIAAMRQVEENHNSLVLVVDDSSTYRTMISELLYIRQFRVLNASDGKSALQILDQYPEIKLVITDFNMPNMDGCLLCQKIREKIKHDRLAIIGFSSENDLSIAARFIKSGANDFILKQSFLVEEFYCRVNHCLENIDLIAQIREGAIRDFLTGLHNRRYFFDAGTELFNQCQKSGTNLSCAMFDIDFFKNVNDTYGHDIGDLVIKSFAGILQSAAGEGDIVARIGGEEFCVLISGAEEDELLAKLEGLRHQIESTPAAHLSGNNQLFITSSIGVCLSTGKSLDAMVKIADESLYRAKNGGRNRIEAS